MSPRPAFPPALALRLAAFHGALALIALCASRTACLAAAAVSAFALMRYLALAAFTASIGSGDAGRTALVVGAWFAAALALAAAVAGTARLARPVLPWAAAAAFAGPVELLFEALFAGLRQSGAARGGRAA